jgi:hypothetical protein
MSKQLLRNTIIDLLDDCHGINNKAHDGVVEICSLNGWHDINEKTELEDGRAYLWEADAEELRKVVVEG